MHFLLILTVVAALAAADAAPAVPLGDGHWRLFAMAAAAATAPLLAIFLRWLAVRLSARRPAERGARLAPLRRLHALHAAAWLVSCGVILFIVSWPQLVRADWQLGRWLLADELTILAPLLLPLVLSWPALCDMECAFFAANVQPAGHRSVRRRQYMALRARHYLGLVVLPVLALVAIDDCVKLFLPQLAHSRYGWVTLCVPIALLLALFPLVLRVAWGATPLPDGALRRRLLAAGRASGFVPRDLLVWHTGRTMVNAAVAGFLPPLRYVFLSDGLVEKFDEDEIAAVFAHEAGHVRRRHLATRGLVMVVPVVAWIGVCAAAPNFVDSVGRASATLGIGAPLLAALAAPLGLALYAATALAWCSRLLEFEADLWACRSIAAGTTSTDALRTYAGVLEKLASAGGLARRRSTWLHPSVAERLAFLERSLADSFSCRRFGVQLRLARGLAAVGLAGLVACLAAGALSAVTG